MIKTLYVYIAADLARVMLMALAAFTVVMTVFGVAEPLREMGLSGSQVLLLFGFTVPVMLSLTLPIAALFAATFVYGRFSQTNELVAARASGVSAISLLKPALALGAVVTVLSLVMSNYLTPAMAVRGEHAVKDNVQAILYQQLRAKSYLKDKKGSIVHADMINAEQNTILGLVAAQPRKHGAIRLVVAPVAHVTFDSEGGRDFATLQLRDTAAAWTNKYDIVRVGEFQLQSVPLPSLVEEKPDWYNWDQLCATLKSPEKNREIRSRLAEIRRDVCTQDLGDRIAPDIDAGKVVRLTDGQYDYDISAGVAMLERDGSVKLLQAVKGNALRRVKIVERRHGNHRKTVTAHSGRIFTDKHLKISVELSEKVQVRIDVTLRDESSVPVDPAGGDHGDSPRRSEWNVDGLLMPEDLLARSRAISLDEIFLDPKAYTANLSLLDELRRTVNKLRSQIVAEMHGRVAYSLSCCLMVALGAAMGLMFRGGQLLSAFAISVVPAALVIVLVVMGKELVVNPDVRQVAGLGAIWGGPVLLVIANVAVYGRLVRQ